MFDHSKIVMTIISGMFIFVIQLSLQAMDLQNTFIPFSGDAVKHFPSSTVFYDPGAAGKVAPNEEQPPAGICIGSGGYSCICRDCNCCTSDCPPCKTSPVISGGAYERIDTDFSLQGKGFPFSFTRYYYSSGKNIGSVGLAWTSNLDISLVIVGSSKTKAYFQTERSTIAFTMPITPTNCESISYKSTDLSKRMIIKGLTVDSQCYYALYDYDNERDYIFYKDQQINNHSLQGLLQKECDFYNNCWVYTYEDITGSGMIAPTKVENFSGANATGIWAHFDYLSQEYPYQGENEYIKLLSEIHDNYQRSWKYYYDVEFVNYTEHQYIFVGVQGSYPRLSNVTGPGDKSLWRYDYYEPGNYDVYYRARPGFLTQVFDRTGRSIATITYNTPDNTNPPSQQMDRVQSVTNEEGTLQYNYASCGEFSNQGFCKDVTKTVNGAAYQIGVDDTTGYLNKISNPDGSFQQYCYKEINQFTHRLEYFKDENNNYTRYYYDDATGVLLTLTQNACPVNDKCQQQSCTNVELTWIYEYFTDPVTGVPARISKILAPAGFQSMQYVYYLPGPPPDPDCPTCPPLLLKAIYRIEANLPNYDRKVDECSPVPGGPPDPACKLIASYTYYPEGMIKEKKDVLGNTTSYEYASTGELSQITYPPNSDNPPPGPAYLYSYQYQYDPDTGLFKTETTTDPLNNSTIYSYDALDRLKEIRLPNPGNGAIDFITRNNFDIRYKIDISDRRCTDHIDANNITTRSCYDKDYNLVDSTQDYGTQPGNKNIGTSYHYQNGLLQWIIDANDYQTNYYYDERNRLIGIDYPDVDAGTYCAAPQNGNKCDVRYAYYPNGLLRQKTDAKGQIITHSYDSLGRLITKDYGSSKSISYDYTSPSNLNKYIQMLMKVTDTTQTPQRTTEFNYDGFFRVSSITIEEGNPPAPLYIIAYSYDEKDRLLTYKIDNDPAVTYQYYPDSSIKRIERDGNVLRYTYLPTGQKDRVFYPFSGASPAIQYLYDAQGRLKEIQNHKKDNSFLSKYIYTYDFNPDTNQPTVKGNRAEMEEDIYGPTPETRNEKYYYDSLYQLTSTNYQYLSKVYSWTYDKIGNRLTQITPDPGSTFNYTYYQIISDRNSQLLRHDGSKCYVWDNNGNLRCTKAAADANLCPTEPHDSSICPTPSSPDSAIGDTVYTWDAEDKLIQLQWYANNTWHNAQYSYEYNGNRYKKDVDGAVSKYIYHNEDIVKEISSNNYHYVHSPGIDEPAFYCTDDSCSSPYYYFADGLGSIRQITDNSSQSNIQNQYRYGSWGELSSPFIKTDPLHNFYTYTSRELSENNLYYYRARYFNSNNTRFINKDIFGPNRFTYATNDPANMKDPYGLWSISCTNGFIQERIRYGIDKLKEEYPRASQECKDYFRQVTKTEAAGSGSWAFENWLFTEKTPPYIGCKDLPGDVCGGAQNGPQWLNMWIDTDCPYPRGASPAGKCFSPCAMGSLILHEMIHLTRKDTWDYEDVPLQRTCTFGCIEPAKYK